MLLRIMTIFGMLGYIGGSFLAGYNSPGMRAIIIFSFFAVIINLYHSARLFIEKRPIFLPEDIREVYDHCFPMLSTKEFHEVYKLSTTKRYTKSAVIAVQEQSIGELLIIIKGNVSIIKNNELVNKLGPHFFIGEMSYITGGPATATVESAEDNVECLVWKKDILNQIKEKNIDLYNKFIQAIAVGLVKKLASLKK